MFAYLHLVLHFLLPLLIAWFFFRPIWLRAALVMLATNLVDLDHLWADPVYAPDRCSINFHPLHKLLPIAVYGALLFMPWIWLRLAGIGLIVHMLLEALDCGI